jgi:hypothetical protein
MASGTIVGTKYISGGHYWLELVWTDSTVTTGPSGTSSVVVKTYFCSDWSANFSATKNGSTTVNGSALNWSSGVDISHPDGTVKKTLVYTRSGVSVTHNADGTKSITISGTYTPNITISGYGTLGTMSASGTAVLNDVYTPPAVPPTWVWTGSAWVRAKAVKVWDGTVWTTGDAVKAWTKTAWNSSK